MKTILLPNDFIPLDQKEFEEKAKENNALMDDSIKKDPELISKIPLIHQTTSERALKILETWYIAPYSDLKKSNSKSVSDSMKNNTDELDKILWLDNYWFFSYWKIAPLNRVDDLVYFCFDPIKVWNTTWTIISKKEICEFWATVSKVWANYYMEVDRLTIEQIQRNNKKAIESFYGSLIIWQTFEKMFPWFIWQYSNQILDYLIDITYPWEKMLKWKMGEVLNYWQWFQFMVPSRVSINNLTWIMCWENTKYKKIKKIVWRKWVRVIKTKDIKSLIKQQTWEVLWQENTVSMNLLLYFLHNNKIKSRNIKKGLRELWLI